jgi:hypothetical protein
MPILAEGAVQNPAASPHSLPTRPEVAFHLEAHWRATQNLLTVITIDSRDDYSTQCLYRDDSIAH